jgi:hypothetical protein
MDTTLAPAAKTRLFFIFAGHALATFSGPIGEGPKEDDWKP